MRLFQCQVCDSILHFENRSCERCGHKLAYLPELSTLSALRLAEDAAWVALAMPHRPSRFCANAAYDACNWFVPLGSDEAYCLACRHNGTIPNVSDPAQLLAWQQIEIAKHRLFYTLLRWNLPLKIRAEDPEHGLLFDFLADPPETTGPKVLTGHDNGVITITLVEGRRRRAREAPQGMSEPYCTLIGHFRHEVGHHYWDILVRDGGKLDACRVVFGDDTEDYAEALKRHYAEGAPPDWQEHYVSSYATPTLGRISPKPGPTTCTFVDTLEMASAFGLQVHPNLHGGAEAATKIDFNPYDATSIEQIMAAWFPFVLAMNSVNRAMGNRDLYPFVLAPP
jgi:hypothetical protein